MCTRRVDRYDIAYVYLWESPSFRELVIVLAETACHIVRILPVITLTEEGDMMIGIIHSRSHQTMHTRIDSDEVQMFLRNILYARDESSSRTRDISPILHIDFRGFHARLTDEYIMVFLHSSCEDIEIDIMITRSIGDADTATEIDPLEVDSYLSMDQGS